MCNNMTEILPCRFQTWIIIFFFFKRNRDNTTTTSTTTVNRYCVLMRFFFFSPSSANIDPSRRYLYFQIRGGKAFMDQLAEEDSGQGPSASFTLHIHFRGQRFKSRPVSCACEPSFEEGFLLELHKEGAGMNE